MSQRLYLVDASIYIFQAHFSPQMIWSRRAEDRSAFAGFARFLLRLLQVVRRQASQDGSGQAGLAVAFDESLFRGFRHRLYADYKSNRVLPDENLARQLAACVRLCRSVGVQAFSSQEYEADDIIGTLAARARMPLNDSSLATVAPTAVHTATENAQCTHGRQQLAGSDGVTDALMQPDVVIVTRDKDLSQVLHSDQDHLWDFQTGERRFRQDIHTRYGIWPEQFPCYLGLAGDSSDCIPGVPGVGHVSATRLLQHFGDLDQLYQRLDEVTALLIRGARRCANQLREHEELARLSRTLATLVQCDDADEAFASVDPACLHIGPVDQKLYDDIIVDMGLTDDECRRLVSMLQPLMDERAPEESIS